MTSGDGEVSGLLMLSFYPNAKHNNYYWDGKLLVAVM